MGGLGPFMDDSHSASRYFYKWRKYNLRNLWIMHPFSRPLVYRSLEASQSCTTRTLSYCLPSLIISVILNLPKFLEASLVITEETNEEMNIVEVIDYAATDLRRNPDYIYYYVHWTRWHFLIRIILSQLSKPQPILGLTWKCLCKPHPQKLNITNITAVTDSILMKL